MDNERSAVIIRMYTPQRPDPDARRAGLDACVALVLSTYRSDSPDLVLDHELWFACVRAVGVSLRADRVEIVEVPEHRGLFSVFKPQKPRIHSVEEYEALLNRGDDEPEWQSKTWMEPELAAFLNSLHANFADTIVWGNGAIRLDLKGYLDIQSPPDRFVLAGRAMVVRGNEVLLVETPYGNHILPGGRRENGETTEDAVQREVLEETGWVVNNLTPFAVLHLQYQTPMPQNVGRVIYPDFIWHVFIAEPSEYREQRRIQDEREVVLAANFKPIGEVLKSGLAPFQQELLAALVR